MALYVHYLYLPGKAGQQQYPPKMTPHLRKRLGCSKFFTVINEANRTFFSSINEYTISMIGAYKNTW